MSTDESLQGSWRIPKKHVSPLRKSLKATEQNYANRLYDEAVKWWEDPKNRKKRDDPFGPATYGDTNIYIIETASKTASKPTKKMALEAAKDKDFDIAISDDGHVGIDVLENNHAVDRARRHPVFISLFRYLEHRIEWRKPFGGAAYYRNEHFDNSTPSEKEHAYPSEDKKKTLTRSRPGWGDSFSP